jgi:hypothetical protein
MPFHQRLEAWLDAHVTIEIRDVPAPATHNPIVAVERELLPISFSVEAGAYINTIRSSLDILAMALVISYDFRVIRSDWRFWATSGSLPWRGFGRAGRRERRSALR